jgi:hypothetical protein
MASMVGTVLNRGAGFGSGPHRDFTVPRARAFSDSPVPSGQAIGARSGRASTSAGGSGAGATLTSPPSPATRGLPLIGEGRFARVYRDGSHVIKEVKARHSFLAGDLTMIAARDRFARHAVRVSESLRTDPIFSHRYPGLIPHSSSPAPGQIRQQFRTGTQFSDLSPEAQVRALVRVAEIVALANLRYPTASGILPFVGFDPKPVNFLFDSRGNPTSWNDPAWPSKT